VKNIAIQKDTATSAAMDDIIDLWTQMLEADAEHDQKICTNVEQMQRRADTAVTILRENLARLHAFARTAVTMEGEIAIKEAKLLTSLSEERLAHAAQLERLKTEHDKSLDLVAALRRQIKETKDALELDDTKLQDIKSKVQEETADRQKQLEARVKVAAAAPTDAKGGRMKLGAGAPPRGGALPVPVASVGKAGLEFGAMDVDGDGVLTKEELQSMLRNMGWSLEEVENTFKAMDRDRDGGISTNEYAAFCHMEDKNLEFGTLSGIANLRQQLADLQAKLDDLQVTLPPPPPLQIYGVGMLLEAQIGHEELWVTQFSQVLNMETFYRKYTRALNFQEWIGDGARAWIPSVGVQADPVA
jgi:hypothetical protein